MNQQLFTAIKYKISKTKYSFNQHNSNSTKYGTPKQTMENCKTAETPVHRRVELKSNMSVSFSVGARRRTQITFIGIIFNGKNDTQ